MSFPLKRRAFFSALLTGIPAFLFAQKAVVRDGQVKACPEGVDVITCPNGHKTCENLKAGLVVGNGDANYPNWLQVPGFTLYWCDQCGGLFARKA